MLGILTSAIIIGLAGTNGTLILVSAIPLGVLCAMMLHPWVAPADHSTPWIPYLVAAILLLPSILPGDGAIAAWSEKFAFGIPAFIRLVIAGVTLVGRGVGVVRSGAERIAVCVGLIIAAILVVSLAHYTPSEPKEVQRALGFCKDTVEGAKPDGAGHFLSAQR